MHTELTSLSDDQTEVGWIDNETEFEVLIEVLIKRYYDRPIIQAHVFKDKDELLTTRR